MSASGHVADAIQAAIERSSSLACVGLDPRVELLPPALIDSAGAQASGAEAVAAGFLAFNRGLLEAIAEHCAAVKPQVACYEAYGPPGMRALRESIAYARELGIPVIADAKRGDIGSTARHYQEAWLSAAPDLAGRPYAAASADWLTVNGYLGEDSLRSCLPEAPGEAGIFVLVKTSNPGSASLQGLRLADGRSVAEAMADLGAALGAGRLGRCGLSDVGAVVGATYPDEARALRERMPDTLFLVPGYGAQGGSAADALAGRRGTGDGVLVNSSRGIIAAWRDADAADGWQEAARAALDTMNADLASQR